MLTCCGGTQEELGHLKALWDMAGAVMATFSAWHATLWDKIMVDELVEETRKMIREMKTLSKAGRGYEVYRCAQALPGSRTLMTWLHQHSSPCALAGCWRRRSRRC